MEVQRKSRLDADCVYFSVDRRGSTRGRSGSRARNWTTQAGKDEFILLLASRRRAGASLQELAAEFNLSKSYVGHLSNMEDTARVRATERARRPSLLQPGTRPPAARSIRSSLRTTP